MDGGRSMMHDMMNMMGGMTWMMGWLASCRSRSRRRECYDAVPMLGKSLSSPQVQGPIRGNPGYTDTPALHLTADFSIRGRPWN
jgi:hypothetical protein